MGKYICSLPLDNCTNLITQSFLMSKTIVNATGVAWKLNKLEQSFEDREYNKFFP
jgi:hypothetical protein